MLKKTEKNMNEIGENLENFEREFKSKWKN